MPAEPGQTLSHYRMIEKIGEGGMGVVWKALDTTLDRDVAIKVLPDAFAEDQERLARFEREAKTLAALNHPNIAAIHGLEESDGLRFLVMELVPGESLAQRLARGPMPVEEALTFCRQIAEALEAAHEKGIIHRDLKPGNIQITPEGKVKVLDFGLAKTIAEEIPVGDIHQSPTLAAEMTRDRTILGTAAYMSPEQARGQVVDVRADLWAFGVVLYEMLGGRSPFRGDTASDTLASILKLDPDYDALPPNVPNRIRRLVTRCLRKELRKRLHHIADARIVLEETLEGAPDEEATDVQAAQKRRATERLLWLAAVVLVAVATAVTAWQLSPTPSDHPHRKLQIALDGVDPDDPGLNPNSAKISPNGKRLLYSSGKRVFVRDLDAWESREIVAAAGAKPIFWSPDGRSIGFVNDETLSRAAADGSHVAVISELPGATRGAAWGPDGKILLAGRYSDRARLLEVSERGGDPKERWVLEEGKGHFHNLDILPGGRGVLITVHQGTMKDISVIADGKLTSLVEIDSQYLPTPVYALSGHVLYTRGGSNGGLWALPFSAETLEITGEPFLVAAGAGWPSVSRDGTLVYFKNPIDLERRLVWVDRQGKIVGSIGRPGEGFAYPALSPDGEKIVVSTTGNEAEADLWIIDVKRGTQTRLLHSEGAEVEPVWTTDGKRVAYRHWTKDGASTIRITNADGSGEPETLAEGKDFSLSPDGRFLILGTVEEQTKFDMWLVELGTGAEPVPLVCTEANELYGRVSPDGGTLAYVSNESGRREIYLKRFPSGEGKWQVSLDGGSLPRWSPNGDELFWSHNGDLMVAKVRTEPEITLGTPRRLFTWAGNDLYYRHYDVAPDAERFVLVTRKDEHESSDSSRNMLMLVENWSAE